MFKKRHSQSQISPLDPPPASTIPQDRRMSIVGRPMNMNGVPAGFEGPGGAFRGPPNGQQQQLQQQPYPQRQYSSGSGPGYGPGVSPNGSMRGQGPGHGPLQNPPELIAGPQYGSGSPVERVMSSKSKAGSEKSEKRRSGFFGFGRKKDKDKDREEEKRLPDVREQEPQSRSSFSVNRDPNQLGQQQGQLQRFSSPLAQTPSGPMHQNQLPNQRIASNPMPPAAQGDFGPSQPNRSFPKSQSMGFTNQPNQLPSQPGSGYGGFDPNQQQQQPPRLNMGERQYSNGSDRMPKSASMPLDKQMTGPGAATPPTNGTSSASSPARSSPNPAIPAQVQASAARMSDVQRSRAASNASGPVPGSAGPPRQQPDWMNEFASIVDLIGLQPGKTYLSSPPELEMILARTSAGGQPKQGQPGSASNDWDAVWLQLSGISLSMWSMKETRAAAAKGEKVPPTYFNVTDSSLELLAALPPPPHRPRSHPHLYVFSLNTAGSNRLLFSCPSERDISRWATSLRLAAWERARLEEIYTGHLIKSGGKEPKSELRQGRMEGWVRVRIMGGTDWKRLWAVLSMPGVPEGVEDEKKQKRKSFFGLGGGSKDEETPVQEPNTGVSMASFYTEQRTAKNRATAPVLTITSVTQTYAVFPERLEVISQSNLMKVVGRIGGEMVAIEGRLRDSGWALIMPESAEGTAAPPNQGALANMMRWVTGFHDVFGLYGRPERYSWNERDPKSLFFAYPKGQNRNKQLFLNVDEASTSDYRTTTLPVIRNIFTTILQRKLEQPPTPKQPPYPNEKQTPSVPEKPSSARNDQGYRLPTMSFEKGGSDNTQSYSDHSQPRSSSPITERTDIASRNNSQKTAKSIAFPERQSGQSKQGSGSSKLSPTKEQSHLEAIPDADTGGDAIALGTGQRTAGHVNSAPNPDPTQNKPEVIESPKDMLDYGATAASPMTAWSQSSATTPMNELSQGMAMTSIGDKERALSSQTQNQIQNTSVAPIPLATPISLSKTATAPYPSEGIHSPIPRKVSTGEISNNKLDLHEEPAARYLMDMVDEDHPANQARQAAAADAADKTRPTIITDLAKSPQPPSLGRKPSGARAQPVKKSSGPKLDSVDDVGSNPPAQGQERGGLGVAPLEGHMRQSTYDYEDAHAYLAYAEEPSPIAATFGNKAAAMEGGRDHGPGIAGAAAAGAGIGAVAGGGGLMTKADLERVSEPVDEAPIDRSGTEPAREQPESVSDLPSSIVTVQSPVTAASPIAGKRQGSLRVLPPVPQQAQQQVPTQGQRLDTRSPSSPPVQGQTQQPQFNLVSAREAQPRPDAEHRSSTMEAPPSAFRGYTDRDREQVERTSPAPSSQPQRTSQYDDGRAASQQRQSSASFEPPQPSYMERPRSRSPGGNNMPHRASQFEQPSAPFMDQQPRSRSPGMPQPQHRSSSYSLRQQAQQQQDQMYPSSPARQPPPPTSRQTMWNANFASGHGMPEQSRSSKFVELDEPQAQLTKAFAPHGLLQAGLQDKEERSAKKQEELAREMGASLVNVPSKPPPPSAGLLGAVAQHEKERKGAGGIGATLTDREREKRVQEERQREMEKMQRQQMESGQFGFPPGGYGYGGMGMPMMGMPNMGFNPYQNGYNPYAAQQAMFAAQMAYNNAMMAAMSQAGSQAGDHAGNNNGNGNRSPSPAGSQFGHGNMSMYGGGGGGNMMPWMNMNMGSPSPGMGPNMGMMGMGMGMPGMTGMPGMMGMGQGQGSQYGGTPYQQGGPGQGPGQGQGSDYLGQQYTGRGSNNQSQAGTPGAN